MAEGILYGIGVGPGDPELMTLKAVRILKEVDLVAAPGKDTTAVHADGEKVHISFDPNRISLYTADTEEVLSC